MISYTHKTTGMTILARQYEPGMEDGWYNKDTDSIHDTKQDASDIAIMEGATAGSVVAEPLAVTTDHMIIEHNGYIFIYEKSFFLKMYTRS